jgi:hypothetical protein
MLPEDGMGWRDAHPSFQVPKKDGWDVKRERKGSVEQKDRKQILVGGVVLVTLGILILLNGMTKFGFEKSWPILLIVISITTLAQSPKDLVGWFIGIVGLIFLIDNNWSVEVGTLKTYVLPPLLIVIGLVMLYRRSKK